VIAVGLGVWLLGRPSAITGANIAKIQDGMTRTQVEAILGGPARDDSRGGLVVYLDGDSVSHANPNEWIGEDQAVTVHFENDHVSGRRVGLVARSEEGVLARLRRWLCL
jgi:outer membrane protein assembly factor BamE (lipoprotein component of BamABCDE complex)